MSGMIIWKNVLFEHIAYINGGVKGNSEMAIYLNFIKMPWIGDEMKRKKKRYVGWLTDED
jgi:hypothetical protein